MSQKILKPSLPPVKDSGIVKWGYRFLTEGACKNKELTQTP